MNNIEKDKPKDNRKSKNIAIIILSILLIASIGSCAAILIDNHQKELTREAGYNGYDEGYSVGYSEGKESLYDSAYKVGYDEGYDIGYDAAYKDGYSKGRSVGYDKGYSKGYDEGYDEGDNESQYVSSPGRSSNSNYNTGDTSGYSDTYVYITDTGSKYHREFCRYLSQSKHKISLSSAESSGYTPCSACF